MLLFEWDPHKAKRNIEIHDVSFDEASTAFKDILSLTIYDPLHSSETENRFILIGISVMNRLLIVVHSERNGRIRIISSRKAKIKERTQYEENAKRFRNA